MSKALEPREQMLALTDVLVDDLMRLSDDELLAEFLKDGEDPESVAAEVRRGFDKIIAETGKAKLSTARAAMMAARSVMQTSAMLSLSLQAKEAILGKFAAADPKLKGRLTMAHRHGGSASESEIDSILLDLKKVGAIDDDGNPL